MKNKASAAYLQNLFDKYKYVLLIGAIGLLLLLWPQPEKEIQLSAAPAQSRSDELEARLQAILEVMDGVGKATVLLTVEHEGETEYAYDRTESQTVSDGGGSQSRQQEMVTLSESGGQRPVTLRCSAPQYRGAVVVCEGGDRAAVRLAVTQVVQSLTGISTDRIVISKMKQ